MRSTFYLELINRSCYQAKFRLVKGNHLSKIKLKKSEIVLNIDRLHNEVLIGKPTFETTNYEGKLYEKLIELDLPHEGGLNKRNKSDILNFISKYSIPLGPIVLEELAINWLFIPYKINLKQGEGDFFTTFRNMYVDFKDVIDIIISGKLENLKNLEGPFDNGLAGNHVSLKNKDEKTPFKWVSDTCLNLCYLELYELILSKQKLKVCKYCSKIFESSKTKEVKCDKCKDPNVYMSYYNDLHRKKLNEQAKVRMQRHRDKMKKTFIQTNP